MDYSKLQLKIEKIPLDKITLDEQNAKEHPDWQVDQIVESIKRFGNCDPIGIWGDRNLIVEGHGRYAALQRLGVTEADCIRLDHLDADERKAYAIAHNSTNMSTGFDWDKLREIVSELGDKFDFENFGVEVDKLDDAAEAQEDDYDLDLDAVPDRVKRGQVWRLGDHLLICGDSTDAEIIARLFANGGGGYAQLAVTDPPYNVDYEGKTKEALTIQNDRMSPEEFRAFLTKAFSTMATHMQDGAAFYVWYASREHVNFEAALRASGLTPRQQLIWVKNVMVLGRQDYQWRHEPCIYGWKDGAAHYFRDVRNQTTVQEAERPANINTMRKAELLSLCRQLLEANQATNETVMREDKPAASELHPTMKPIRLIARLIANSSKRGDIVLDPFGGSGSTLIACEQLGRVCRMVELDERYASAIVDRWEQLTGKTAQQVEDDIHSGSGKD